MSDSRLFHVYILASRSRRIYTGVTGNLQRRMYEHQHHLVPGFTDRYDIVRLVYFEAAGDPASAIAREKQIKGWLRAKKLALIEDMNPEWKDLSEGLFA